ncbi:MutS-related protein [Terrisporobacter mayombei]|uniref:DNA mismatch repair protein MutS n=1 Tax=Terrisporobacter mayombei TaxID=1541 RepID=A0ABY9Q1K3_9FIRM|nr:DNA mismatch repair protein MutS [Terrisporobacter mayombei]MCC3866920.1 DNA mismatch repair protein MutS [Terrisporobacter mayombei]WMT81165.1 DNA mismatch repair protein MutS [Terrisporobacter mayombei]
MGDIIKIVACIILMIIICSLYDLYSFRKGFNKNKAKIIKNYGCEINIEDADYKMNNIATFFKNKDQKKGVDDITWSDLSMDDVYKKINNTQSSAGREVLYDMLRNPLYTLKELKKRDNIIEYFMHNFEERLKLQLILSNLGYNYDANTTLCLFLEEDNSKNRLKFYRTLRAIPFISLLLMGINKSFLIITMLSVALNIFISFNNKNRKIDTSGFTYIIKTINVAFKIKDMKIKELDNNLKNIDEDLEKVKKIKKKSVSKNPNSILSDLNFFSEYANMITLSELITYEKVKETIIKNKEYLKNIYEYVGGIDALISITSFRTSLDYFSKPQLSTSLKKEDNITNFEEIYHPLISHPVSNSLEINRGVLITGSNASGKSTFIKSVAINQILCQSIYTSCTKKYEGTFFNIYTSMALKDDVLNEESYYMVEIKSLKRIIDKCNENVPCLCFVDEILRGTNTVERIASSSEVLSHLNKSNTICIAATHDIELTYLLEKEYDNYHFEEEITDDDIVFDYKLNKDRAKSKNAIKLLSLIGYEKNIVERAHERAENFVKSGKWI